jgi:hypothetical protein
METYRPFTTALHIGGMPMRSIRCAPRGIAGIDRAGHDPLVMQRYRSITRPPGLPSAWTCRPRNGATMNADRLRAIRRR